MILVDANILMYAGGAEHPHREPSLSFLARVAAGDIQGVLDAEVLQEIFHRYRALNRWEDGRQVYALARRIFTIVLPVDLPVLDRACQLLDRYPELTARDGLHAAIVTIHGLAGLCSYDRDFDQIEDLTRIEP